VRLMMLLTLEGGWAAFGGGVSAYHIILAVDGVPSLAGVARQMLGG